jgi:putative restriction endonuclease
MPHCVFMHKANSIYDDIPAERYQFPAQYFGRAEPSIGDWEFRGHNT